MGLLDIFRSIAQPPPKRRQPMDENPTPSGDQSDEYQGKAPLFNNYKVAPVSVMGKDSVVPQGLQTGAIAPIKATQQAADEGLGLATKNFINMISTLAVKPKAEDGDSTDSTKTEPKTDPTADPNSRQGTTPPPQPQPVPSDGITKTPDPNNTSWNWNSYGKDAGFDGGPSTVRPPNPDPAMSPKPDPYSAPNDAAMFPINTDQQLFGGDPKKLDQLTAQGYAVRPSGYNSSQDMINKTSDTGYNPNGNMFTPTTPMATGDDKKDEKKDEPKLPEGLVFVGTSDQGIPLYVQKDADGKFGYRTLSDKNEIQPGYLNGVKQDQVFDSYDAIVKDLKDRNYKDIVGPLIFRQGFGDKSEKEINAGGGVTAQVFRNKDGSIDLYDSKTGAVIDQSKVPQEALSRATQIPATVETVYKDPALVGKVADGTINPASFSPIMSEGKPIILDAKVVEGTDKNGAKQYWLVPTTNGERKMTDAEVQAAYERGATLGAYDTPEHAQQALAVMQEKTANGSYNYKQKDELTAKTAAATRPYSEGEDTWKIKTSAGKQEVYYRDGGFYNVKDGKYNAEASKSSKLKDAQTQAEIDAMPTDTLEKRLAQSRAQVAFESDKAYHLENDKIVDKTHNIWDVLRTAGLGAFKGFLTGGIGGAVGGAIAGGIGGAIDKTADTKLKRDMFDIPRQQEQLAKAQQRANLYQSQYNANLAAQENLAQIKKLDVETDGKVSDIINTITEHDKGYMEMMKQGYADAKGIKAYEDRMTEELQKHSWWPKGKRWTSGMTPGTFGEMEDGGFDTDGTRLVRSKTSNLLFPAEVVSKNADGTITKTPLKYISKAQGSYQVVVGEGDEQQVLDFKGTQEELNKIMKDFAIWTATKGVDIDKFNAEQKQKAAIQNADAFNSRVQAAATITKELKTVNPVRAQQYNMIMGVIGSNEPGKESGEYLQRKNKVDLLEKGKKPDETADSWEKRKKGLENDIEQIDRSINNHYIQASGLIEMDESGKPVVQNSEGVKAALEILKTPVNTIKPVLLDRSRTLRIKPGSNTGPGVQYNPGSSSSLDTRRRRPTRNGSDSASA